MNSNKIPKIPKYRISLSLDDLVYLTNLAKQDYADSSSNKDRAIGVIADLNRAINNAIHGSTKSAYDMREPESIQDKLGIATGLEHNLDHLTAITYESPTIDKETYWSQCYDRLELYGPETLSIVEIDAANEHRYLNDLMNIEEIAEYEKATSQAMDTKEKE